MLAVSIFIFSAADFAGAQWWFLGAYSVVAVILFAVAKIPAKRILSIWIVPLMGLMVAFFRVFNFLPFEFHAEEISGGMLYTARFFVATLYALVFFETTSSSQIIESIENIQTVAERIFPPFKYLFIRCNFSLIIGLTIGFIPRLFAAWQQINIATKARSRKTKNPILIIKIYLSMFSALLSTALYIAATTRLAVLNRLSKA